VVNHQRRVSACWPAFVEHPQPAAVTGAPESNSPRRPRQRNRQPQHGWQVSRVRRLIEPDPAAPLPTEPSWGYGLRVRTDGSPGAA